LQGQNNNVNNPVPAENAENINTMLTNFLNTGTFTSLNNNEINDINSVINGINQNVDNTGAGNNVVNTFDPSKNKFNFNLK
jgi:hypothetical protein